MKRRASLRLRLTFSYGAVFFMLSLLLFAAIYALGGRHIVDESGGFKEDAVARLHLSQSVLDQQIALPTGGRQPVGALVQQVEDAVILRALHVLYPVTFVALAIATVTSVGIGWLAAGRMLRPIHEISGVARRLSASTLHERIAMTGPHDELRNLADTFDDMLARLESSFQAQVEFAANASHELKTPLAIMRTRIDVTLADPQAKIDDLRDMAETIRAAIDRSDDVVERLLILADTREATDKDPVELGAVTRRVVGQHRRAAEEKALSFDLAIESGWVCGDSSLLERLVDNLIDNAVRYASRESVVRIHVGNAPGGVEVMVANDGEVIDRREVPRLFERFYRRETSRSRATGGSGLGMAIVAAVAEAHGGSVAAEGPAAGGLRVTVTLPQLPADAVEEGRAEYEISRDAAS